MLLTRSKAGSEQGTEQEREPSLKSRHPNLRAETVQRLALMQTFTLLSTEEKVRLLHGLIEEKVGSHRIVLVILMCLGEER